MEHLLLLYFKDKPAVLHAWHRLRMVLINVLLLGLICTSILAKRDNVRSFSLGVAAGIVMLNLGQSINTIRNVDDRDKSVNS